MRPALLLCTTLLVVLIAGCATPAHQRCRTLAQKAHEARQTLIQSLIDYKACLAENPSDPLPCATLKAIFEADAEVATALSAGVGGGDGGDGSVWRRMGGVRAPLTRYPDEGTNCY